MKVLTIRQPWASAIVSHGKDVENRNWLPPGDLDGHFFAIHAGQALDRSALEKLQARKWIPREISDLPLGAILGVARLDRLCLRDAEHARRCPSRWRDGERFGWHLADVVAFRRPVAPVKGRLGLWNLPRELLGRFCTQLQLPASGSELAAAEALVEARKKASS